MFFTKLLPRKSKFRENQLIVSCDFLRGVNECTTAISILYDRFYILYLYVCSPVHRNSRLKKSRKTDVSQILIERLPHDVVQVMGFWWIHAEKDIILWRHQRNFTLFSTLFVLFWKNSVQEISEKFHCPFVSFVNIGGMEAILYLVT